MVKVSRRTVGESEILFEETKLFFLNEERAQFVIEMSDQPMAEWNIIKVSSPEEMFEVRGDFLKKGADFAGFIHFEGDYNFYFVDKNILKSQNIENGELIAFTDRSIRSYNWSLLMKELRQIYGS